MLSSGFYQKNWSLKSHGTSVNSSVLITVNQHLTSQPDITLPPSTNHSLRFNSICLSGCSDMKMWHWLKSLALWQIQREWERKNPQCCYWSKATMSYTCWYRDPSDLLKPPRITLSLLYHTADLSWLNISAGSRSLYSEHFDPQVWSISVCMTGTESSTEPLLQSLQLSLDHRLTSETRCVTWQDQA